jgi:hypothetical protein
VDVLIVNVGQKMKNPELFLIRYRQLQECIENQTLESMLLLSQALRQLIVDGGRLVDILNRDYRVTLRFVVGMSSEERVAEMRALNLPEASLHFLGMFPPNEPRKNLNIDQFLKFPVAKYENNHFSVRTIIKTCANRLGGVHAGDAAKDSVEESQVRRFGDVLSNLGMHHAFASLILIAGVTSSGLRPLVDKVTAS